MNAALYIATCKHEVRIKNLTQILNGQSNLSELFYPGEKVFVSVWLNITDHECLGIKPDKKLVVLERCKYDSHYNIRFYMSEEKFNECFNIDHDILQKTWLHKLLGRAYLKKTFKFLKKF